MRDRCSPHLPSRPSRARISSSNPSTDGIRAVVEIEPAHPRALVRLWSRLGNDKTSQFPSIVAALASFGAAAREPLVVDGEIVALDAKGQPVGFQRLQGRIHLSGAKDVERIDREQPVAFIAFDLLREGKDDLRGLPLVERRSAARTTVRPIEVEGEHDPPQRAGQGRRPRAARAGAAEGWEGLIVKDGQSPYQSGRRSPSWRKLKLHQQQEFVVGGWTEPRNTRQYFGALLLGVYRSARGSRGAKSPRESERGGAPRALKKRPNASSSPALSTSGTRAQDSISTSSSGYRSC